MNDDSQQSLLEGINRADLHWNPTINTQICQNCGICESCCKHGVYSSQNGSVEVINPTHCVVLCNNCESQCPHHAISFPNRTTCLKEIRDLRKKKNS